MTQASALSDSALLSFYVAKLHLVEIAKATVAADAVLARFAATILAYRAAMAFY